MEVLEIHFPWGYNKYNYGDSDGNFIGPSGRNYERSHLTMGYVEVLKKRAKESIKTIVLPETEDMRTIEAADKILKERRGYQ